MRTPLEKQFNKPSEAAFRPVLSFIYARLSPRTIALPSYLICSDGMPVPTIEILALP